MAKQSEKGQQRPGRKTPVEAPQGENAGAPATVEPDVGANLRLLRSERGLTLAELAERSGVSKAMLNQIENAKSSPTIALGWKIANGLGVPFGALLGEAEPGDFVVLKRAQLKEFQNRNRALRSRALFPAGDPRAAELYELWLEPQGEERAKAHEVGTREQIYVVTGSLIVETSAGKAELQAGDLVFYRADRPHRYFNPGTTPTCFMLIMRYPPRKDGTREGPSEHR
jgi:transcriptional regulator with XRE-family HTH domain